MHTVQPPITDKKADAGVPRVQGVTAGGYTCPPPVRIRGGSHDTVCALRAGALQSCRKIAKPLRRPSPSNPRRVLPTPRVGRPTRAALPHTNRDSDGPKRGDVVREQRPRALPLATAWRGPQDNKSSCALCPHLRRREASRRTVKPRTLSPEGRGTRRMSTSVARWALAPDGEGRRREHEHLVRCPSPPIERGLKENTNSRAFCPRRRTARGTRRERPLRAAPSPQMVGGAPGISPSVWLCFLATGWRGATKDKNLRQGPRPRHRMARGKQG